MQQVVTEIFMFVKKRKKDSLLKMLLSGLLTFSVKCATCGRFINSLGSKKIHVLIRQCYRIY